MGVTRFAALALIERLRRRARNTLRDALYRTAGRSRS